MYLAWQVVPELIERNFGEYELQSDSMYQRVWDADAASLAGPSSGGSESVAQVLKTLSMTIMLMHTHVICPILNI